MIGLLAALGWTSSLSIYSSPSDWQHDITCEWHWAVLFSCFAFADMLTSLGAIAHRTLTQSTCASLLVCFVFQSWTFSWSQSPFYQLPVGDLLLRQDILLVCKRQSTVLWGNTEIAGNHTLAHGKERHKTTFKWTERLHWTLDFQIVKKLEDGLWRNLCYIHETYADSSHDCLGACKNRRCKKMPEWPSHLM